MGIKLEVGKYIRFRDNNLALITEIKPKTGLMMEDVMCFTYLSNNQNSSNSMYKSFVETIIKSVDTPEDLIQKKDLVFINDDIEGIIEVVSGVGNNFVDTSRYSYYFDNITKILTPNSNGGYDLQWEAK